MHPFTKEVTVMVAVTGTESVIDAVKVGTSPFPPAPSPIDVLLLVQENVTPDIGLVNEVAGTLAPLQTAILAGTVTIAVGFTVIVNVEAVPEQPLIEGVTVIVAITAVVPVLVAVKSGISPIPLAPNPIVVSLLVHENTTPGVELLNEILNQVIENITDL